MNGRSGGLLWIWQWTFRLHKRWDISWPAKLLLVS
jgi:hypothetical protein